MEWRNLFILVFAVVIVYMPGLTGGFIYDDYFNILQNKAITDSQLNSQGILLAMQSGMSGTLGRPISMLSFFLNYKLSGIEPLSYKLVNISIHIINTVLIYAISLRLINTIFKQSKAVKNHNNIAFWIALFWAVHPLNLTAVLYVVQRMTSMAGMFTLIGILVFIHIRESINLTNREVSFRLVSIILIGIIAALCKENGVLLFLLLFVIEVFIYRFEFNHGQKKYPILIFFAFLFVAQLVIVIILVTNNSISFDYTFREYTMLERLFTEAKVIWFYIGQTVIPQAHLFGLHHDDFPISNSLFEPASTLVSVLGIIGVVVGSILTVVKRKYIYVGFGFAFFLVGHILESTIFPLNLVHEHRNYIPSFGLIIIFVVFLDQLFKKISISKSSMLFIVFAGLFSFVTVCRAYTWGDMNRFADKISLNHPNSINSNYEAAYIYLTSYEKTRHTYYLNKAIDVLMKADKLSKNSMKSSITLMHVLSIAGKQQKTELINKIDKNFSGSNVAADELIALRHFVSCLSIKVCQVKPRVIEKLFLSLFENPNVQGRLLDDAYYIYAKYLDEVHSFGESALIILRDIVNRNPTIVEYRVKLVSTLLSYGENAEASIIMSELSENYGFQWDVKIQDN